MTEYACLQQLQLRLSFAMQAVLMHATDEEDVLMAQPGLLTLPHFTSPLHQGASPEAALQLPIIACSYLRLVPGPATRIEANTIITVQMAACQQFPAH